MYPICNYTGPANTWSLSLTGFGKTETFFGAVDGCCNNVIETDFPGKPHTSLHLLFEQIGANNETINEYMRVLQKPKEYTGLPKSQVSIRVETDIYRNNNVTGIQKYINCSDGKHIVEGNQDFGLDPVALAAIVIGSIIAGFAGLTALAVKYCCRSQYTSL